MAIEKELPVNRLATTDAQGKRVYLYPSDVKGRFRKARNILFSVLIGLFFVLPWISIREMPAVLLDLPNRRFTFFGLTLWAHEAPILIFIFLGGALTLFFVTSILGRVWCGWACPQTVFVEGVFRRLERWIEGDSLTRRRLDESPWTIQKVLKRVAKWSSFIFASLLVSHTFVAYFVGVRGLSKMMMSSPLENWTTFLVMAVGTGLVLFDFGWFREQFCVIACPYGRFQSVLMDSRSLAVLYDSKRGEPRKGTESPGQSHGDCINCYRCVQVCPTGIDIRRGVQLECIACTSCIDACDEVMTRIGKPKGLIRYDSELGMQKKSEGAQVISFTWRSRIYLLILCLVFGGLVFALSQRKLLDVTLTRALETPYVLGTQTERGTEIVNHFRLDFNNLSVEKTAVYVELSEESKKTGAELIIPMNPVMVETGQTARVDIFVKFLDKILYLGRAKVTAEIKTKTGVQPIEVQLVGPF